MNHKINLSFDTFSLQKYQVISIIKKCITETLAAEGVNISCEVNVLVTNDTGIQAINLASRQIDKATDVLSFPMFSLEAGKLPEFWDEYLDEETDLCPLGDMAISLERAIAQAKTFGHSVRREIGYLTIHSVLHLLGYDHMDDGPQKAQMRAREEAIASQIRGMQRT